MTSAVSAQQTWLSVGLHRKKANKNITEAAEKDACESRRANPVDHTLMSLGSISWARVSDGEKNPTHPMNPCCITDYVSELISRCVKEQSRKGSCMIS